MSVTTLLATACWDLFFGTLRISLLQEAQESGHHRDDVWDEWSTWSVTSVLFVPPGDSLECLEYTHG